MIESKHTTLNMNQQYNFSSVHGKIRYLLLGFNSTSIEKPMGRLVALKQSMPGVKFLLWCSRLDIHEIVCQQLDNLSISHTANMFSEGAIHVDKDCIVVYENFSGIKPWIRDAFFPGKLMGNKCQLLDTVDEEGSDQGWAKRLAQTNLENGPKFSILGASDDNANNLGIAGGDVLMDGKWVFLGKKSSLLESLIRQQHPAVEIILLEEKAGCEELYHIDLFLTLTGIWINDRYVVLVAQCVPLSPEFEEKAIRLNECLNSIALRLEKTYGLMVVRNPIPVNEHLFAYNNCIVEAVLNQNTVWLPAYSVDFPELTMLQELETKNQTIWRKLGFNPHMVSASYKDLLGVKAGLHCITNELRG